MSQEHPSTGHTYHNIHISHVSGNARVLLGNSTGRGSEIAGCADYIGQYAHSSLRPVANYVPRPTLQQKIKEQLHDAREAGGAETRMLVVWGLGGSGKSQLVLNYIREYRQDYMTVFWIEAGQKETIERDYIQIYQLLFGGLATGGGAVKLEDVVPKVKSWFCRQSGRSLLVLDSADSIDDADDSSYVNLEYFLPDAPLVDVVVTTRSSRAREMSMLEAVEVAEMEASEAAELFQKCAKLRQTTTDNVEEVSKIVKELGYLALAIALAGSYVAETPRLSSDLQQYLPEYRERRKQLLRVKATKLIHRYGESVLSTWETSFTAVARRSPEASRLLTLLAFLNFDDIFLDLFSVEGTSREVSATKGHAGDSSWQIFVSPEIPLDRYAVESAFAVLQTYSLVQWRQDQRAYSMHKLVHAWGCDRLSNGEERELSLAALGLLTGFMRAFRGHLTHELRLVPHAIANFGIIRTAYGSSNGLDEVDLESVAVVGDFLWQLGRWGDEYEVRAFHLGKIKDVAGKEHPDTLTSMNNLALVLSHQGKYEQAEEMHRRTLELTETVSGKEHPDTLRSMNNLASMLSGQGKYEQAEEMHRRTLELTETVSGKEHPHTLTSMSNLAGVLSDQGKYEQAEEIHRRTLELRETVLGKEHPHTLMSMNNLAGVLNHQGKYEQAEEMHRRTLELRETVLGKEHPHTLTSMNNLAGVLSDQGKYEQAEEMHRRTLELTEAVSGKEHPDTLTSMNNLALVLSHQGKYEQAEEMYRRTLELRETVLGKEHPHTLTTMNNLANIYWNQERWNEAEILEKDVLEIRSRTLGHNHPATLSGRVNLAYTWISQGRAEEAVALLEEAGRPQNEVLGSDHSDTIRCLETLEEWLA